MGQNVDERSIPSIPMHPSTTAPWSLSTRFCLRANGGRRSPNGDQNSSIPRRGWLDLASDADAIPRPRVQIPRRRGAFLGEVAVPAVPLRTDRGYEQRVLRKALTTSRCFFLAIGGELHEQIGVRRIASLFSNLSGGPSAAALEPRPQRRQFPHGLERFLRPGQSLEQHHPENKNSKWTNRAPRQPPPQAQR